MCIRDSVETNGIATLKGVQPHIVIKPEAQQAIKASAENQVESIKDTPHATVDELDEANQLISDTLKQAQQEIENTNQDAAVNDFFKQKTAYEMQRSLVGSEMCIRDRLYINP
ncbi:hypothetical protein JMUB7516_27120 [Staphylococcus aureus]